MKNRSIVVFLFCSALLLMKIEAQTKVQPASLNHEENGSGKFNESSHEHMLEELGVNDVTSRSLEKFLAISTLFNRRRLR